MSYYETKPESAKEIKNLLKNQEVLDSSGREPFSSVLKWASLGFISPVKELPSVRTVVIVGGAPLSLIELLAKSRSERLSDLQRQQQIQINKETRRSQDSY